MVLYNGIQSSIPSHPHLLKLNDCLKNEKSNTAITHVFLSSENINKRKPKYVELDEKNISEYNLASVLNYLKIYLI